MTNQISHSKEMTNQISPRVEMTDQISPHAVVIEETSNIGGLGYAYSAAATLIVNDFRNAGNLIKES
jgi:hypothetical protein